MSQVTSGSNPRTLADELRSRADSDLAGLLLARPDLLSPLPGDLSQLATRAGTRASVQRALDRLDTFGLQTAEALALAGPPCSQDDLAVLLRDGEHRLSEALATLRSRALLWGPPTAMRLVRTAQELLAPTPQRPGPTGLGPTLGETVTALSPRRAQELLAANGLRATADPVGAARALAELFSDTDRLSSLLAEAPDHSHEVLRRLMWGPPQGEVSARPATHLRWLLDHALLVPTAPGTVVLPREVALALRGGRSHRDLRPDPPELTVHTHHRPERTDVVAAGQAHRALSLTESLLDLWEREPPAVLRTGGLGVRELKRVAVALDIPEPEAAFWSDLAYAAGLVASDGGTDERYAPTPASDEWLRLTSPERWTRLAGTWLGTTRCAALVGERVPQQGAARGRTADRSLAALGPGLDRGPAPELRLRLLTLLASVEPGAAPEQSAVRERMRWQAPRRMPDTLRELLCSAAFTEAEHLGVTAHGAISGFARPLLTSAHARAAEPDHEAVALLTGRASAATPEAGARPAAPDAGDATEAVAPTVADAGAGSVVLDTTGPELPGTGGPRDTGYVRDDGGAPAEGATVPAGASPAALAEVDPEAAAVSAAELLTPLLPEPLDHFLLQADMTAVAPGPLVRGLARALNDAADVESTGGATVYRFSPASVRRALDAGRTAAELHAFLAEYSRTPVPQPLSYLVDDVARRHGRLRAGTAAGYVTCEDEATLDQVMADRRLAPLRLRRIAPTVLVGPAGGDLLLAALKEHGYAPSAESTDGAAALGAGTPPRRTPPRTAPEPQPDGPPGTDAALLRAAVRAIRSGDHAAGAAPNAGGRPPSDPPSGLPRTEPAETLRLLRAAAGAGSLVWIGYVGADGVATQRVLAPVRVEGGFVTAFDHTAEEVRTYPLHRITGAAPASA
ncbi:helicase-associated domain-containing protein [Streptomyces spiramenti]|uniref:DNA-binding protein n=1 Tax=Streptomyces spiramenti TaxID=2720606 RepID=A0ABX1AM22_9ACTN|nr:helicase-associated domain-containing protein [Streptomyces spiramenti]NJP66120.1 DNA-binding protein [Streptomyces spiramenti]